MDYVVTGIHARRMLRSLRADRHASVISLSWSNALGSIVSGSYVPLTEEGCTRLGMPSAPTKRNPLSVIVPCAALRIPRHDEIDSQVVSSFLPGKPFIRISPEICIAGPELLFIDAAATTPFPKLLLFGMELCGSYTLRQSHPAGGRPVYQVEPVTSMQKIADFVGALKGARLRGITRASRAVPFLMDHAASPMESVLALMLRLPIVRGGLGLGLPKLNADVPIGEEYQRFTVARHVYPDIFFEELPLDIEYESEEFHPEMGDWDALDPASRDAILGKTKKDKQRMRLIQTMGIRVFQVTFDDFKTSASFDFLAEQLLKQIEDLSGKSQRRKRAQLNSTKAILKRSSMLASLLEGSPT